VSPHGWDMWGCVESVKGWPGPSKAISPKTAIWPLAGFYTAPVKRVPSASGRRNTAFQGALRKSLVAEWAAHNRASRAAVSAVSVIPTVRPEEANCQAAEGNACPAAIARRKAGMVL